MTSSNGLDRRKFLKLSVGGTIAVAGLGGVFSHFTAGYSKSIATAEYPIALSSKEFAVIKSLVEVLHPQDGKFPAGVDLGLAQRFDEEVWAGRDSLSSDLKNGIQILEHSPLCFGSFARFSDLSLEKRMEHFQKLLISENEILRQVSTGLRMMLSFFYYNHPSVWPTIGYEGPFVQVPQPPESKIEYKKLLDQKLGKKA
jgi:hypothetical protein